MKLTPWNGLTRSITTRISIFALLNLADVILTLTITSAGLGQEGNPFLYGILGWQLVSVKALGIILVALLLARRSEVMLALNIGMGLVVAWNTYWYLVL